MRHPGTFRLKVDNICSEPFTTADITASTDGSHNAGALQLTLKDEPTGPARYSITKKSANSFKLTVKECVREIGNSEFQASNSSGTIIRDKAAEEGVFAPFFMITEIVLPSTLTTIRENAFAENLGVTGTLTVPRNTAVIESRAFQRMGFGTGSGAAALNLVIQSDKLAKPRPDAPRPFPLRDNLIQNASGIDRIILPQRVYEDYSKAELQAIFGSTFTNYRKPDGTAYDFSSKL